MTKQMAVKTVLTALLFLGLVGCNRNELAPAAASPATTVTVEFVGSVNDKQRDDINRKLEAMLDQPHSSHFIKSEHVGSKLTVMLAPISDVESFAKKIDFGTVIEVNNLNVRVEVK